MSLALFRPRTERIAHGDATAEALLRALAPNHPAKRADPPPSLPRALGFLDDLARQALRRWATRRTRPWFGVRSASQAVHGRAVVVVALALDGRVALWHVTRP